MLSKTCTKCGVEKPITEFWRHSGQKDGRRPDCKACYHKPARPKPTIEERFWSKVDKSGDCWVWQGSTHTNNGYGRFWVSNEVGHVLSHRFAWELVNSQIPNDTEVCHKCNNPPCVNPSHMYIGTHYDNMQQAVLDGRIGKLSADDVARIREIADSDDVTMVEIGKMFSVSSGNIGHILNGDTWGWLE